MSSGMTTAILNVASVIENGKTTVAIQNYFQKLRRSDFRISGLSEKERKQIL